MAKFRPLYPAETPQLGLVKVEAERFERFGESQIVVDVESFGTLVPFVAIGDAGSWVASATVETIS